MAYKKIHFLSTPLWTVLGRAGGIVIPLLVAFFYGATHRADAFFLVFSIVLFLSGLFNRIFESLLIPYLAREQKEGTDIYSFLNGILFIGLPPVTFFFLVFWAVLPAVFSWATGLRPETVKLAAALFGEMIPFLIFGVLVSAQNSIFNFRKRFWFPAASPLLRSVVVIFFLFLFHRAWGIHALTGGYVAGEILRWAAGIFLLVRWTEWKWGVDWKKSASGILLFFREAGYQILALFAIHLIPLTDYWFASWDRPGSVSLFSYADRLFQIPYQLFMAGILQIFFTYWSESYYADRRTEFWRKMRRDVRAVACIAIVFSAALWLFREPVTGLVFRHAELTGQDRRQIASLFGWLVIGLAPAFLQLLYVRVVFIMKRSGVYCIQSWIQLSANIFLNYVLMKRFGLEGIVMATAVVFSLTALWLYFYTGRLEKYPAEVKRS